MAAPFVIMVIRLHVMIMFFKCTDCQVLSTCVLPIYNQECDLNCTTADQSKPISFYKLPDAINPIAQCLGINCMVINASLTAMYSIQSTDSTTTTFRIKNLSWDEKGKWRCEYNSTQDTTDLGFAKFPDDIEYSGLTNNSDIESGTVMQITMKCLYTEIPTLVTLIYQSTGGTARSIPVTCTNTTSSCANNNFVSKLCMPIIQVGTGVVCDGNYSIEIATSVLGNEERKYSLLNGITIKCVYSTSTLTTSTNSSVLTTNSTTSSSRQLQSSKECCFIVYILPFTKLVCILFYILLPLVGMVIIIIIIYLCYWRRKMHNQHTTNGDSSAIGSELSVNKRGKSDTSSISNQQLNLLPYCSDVRQKRHQNEVKDLKNKTRRQQKNTVVKDNDYTLQENGPISEMSTLIATERMTSINSISELSNTPLPMISGSTRTTSIETTNMDANTQTNEIQTNTLRIISNSVSTYQSMFATTTATDISGSFEILLQTMTEIFTMTGYTKSSYNDIISPSTFETSIVFPQTLSETSISLSADTLSDSLIHTIIVSSGSLIATNSSELSMLFMTVSPSYVVDSNIPSLSTLFSLQSLTSDTTDSAFEITNVSRVSNLSLTTDTVTIPVTTATVDTSAVNTVLNSKKSASLLLSISENNSRIQLIETNTESPLMSTSFIDQISNASKVEEPSFSPYQDFSETSVTLSKISINSQLSSSIIDFMDHYIYTTKTLSTSYLDDTRHSFVNFTSVFKTFSLDNAASGSTSLPYVIQPTYHHSSSPTTEYYSTIQTEFKSYVTTSFYESNTDNAATEIYSKRKMTSAPLNMHTSVMPSQTNLASMNDIQDSTTHFQSTYLEPYFQSTDEFFSSNISEYFLSTLQSTSVLLSFNTNANASRVDFSLKTSNMLIFETQNGMATISAELSDFKTTRMTTTIDFNNETLPSMIKPSSQQKNTDNSYIEIGTSFKDLLFSSSHFSGSLLSNYLGLTTLSKVFKSMSTPPTNTVQNRLSEKNKTIIFISITSAVITFIIVILLIIFVRMNISKHNKNPRKEDDINISWGNCNSLPKTFFPDYSFTRRSAHPLMNTSSTSFTMHPYEHNWKDIV